MSQDEQDRTFEFWAMLGAIALVFVAVAAFLARRPGDAEAPTGVPAHQGDDLLTVRIGGSSQAGTVDEDDRGQRPRERDAAVVRRPDDEEPPDGPSTEGPEVRDAPTTDGARVVVAAPDAAPRSVVVQPGETLGEIVQRELGTVKRIDEVVRLNGLDDPDSVMAGQTLQLPSR